MFTENPEAYKGVAWWVIFIVVFATVIAVVTLLIWMYRCGFRRKENLYMKPRNCSYSVEKRKDDKNYAMEDRYVAIEDVIKDNKVEKPKDDKDDAMEDRYVVIEDVIKDNKLL